ncbi:MAG: hypothetical protein KDB26_09425 [Microthrixaceae bacterium]|nr:hypothetical protein [Microthrixaceae bacterium]
MHATDQHVEQWSAWDTGLSNMTDNPWTAAMDGSWTGPAADAGAERAQKLDVYMEKFGDAAKTMKTITEAQQAADERWAQAPSEADVRKAQALWLIAKNSDASNTAALEKEYLELKDKRESEEEAYKRACEDTQKSIEALELPDVPDDSSGTGEKPTDDDKDPKDPTDDDGSDDEEEDDGGLDGSGDDKPGSGEKGDDKPTDPTSPKPTSPSSTTPNPSSSTKPDVTSPSTPNPSSSETPHIPVNASTNLSSDSSASNAPSSSTPKVFPSTQQSTAQPSMATAQPQQVVMTPAQSAPSSSTPASQQQPYRPSSPTPSHSTSTTQRDRTDDTDPVGLIGSPVPVSHAVPVSHSPMPNSSGMSGTSLSSASSSGAPTAPTAAAPGANPSPNTPVGGVGGVGSPLGAGNKTTTSSGRTPTYAADQPSTPDKTVSGGSIGGSADDEQKRREMENEEITRRLQEISDRRAAWDKAQGAA